MSPTLYPAASRGATQIGWLDSHHCFSFGNWFDPDRMGIGALRVLNDDLVAAGAGFPPHPHRDMEIVSYVLEGALAHEDSNGNKGIVAAGEVQFMRAGTGVAHSEMNASRSERVHFLQVWFHPRTRSAPPAYGQEKVAFTPGAWTTLAAPDAGMRIDADARMLTTRLDAGDEISYDLAAGRAGYLYVIEGEARVGETVLAKGDALLVDAAFTTTGIGAHLLLFDLEP